MDECWIMQNSWGRGRGWDGFYFFHTDPDCDGGVLSAGDAIIPIFEKVEKESTAVPLDTKEEEETESTTVPLDTNATEPSTTSSDDETSGAGGMIKTYILFAVANVALFVVFA